MTAGSLLPGMLVNAKVRNILSDGLLVSFLTYFTGTIDPFHLIAVSFVPLVPQLYGSSLHTASGTDIEVRAGGRSGGSVEAGVL